MLPAAAILGSGRTSGVALRRRRGGEEGRRGRRLPGEGVAARVALRGGRRGGFFSNHLLLRNQRAIPLLPAIARRDFRW